MCCVCCLRECQRTPPLVSETWLPFQTHKVEVGRSGHLIVWRGNLASQLPVRGGRKELGRGFVAKIKRDKKYLELQ